MRIKIRFLVLLALISASALVFLTVPCQSQASGLGVQFLQCNNGTLSAVNSISCTCGAPQTCASSGQLIVIYSRDDDNSGTITHAASDSVAGTTGWNQAGCAIGNLRIAHCIFWKIATTGTALGFTVSYTPTGVVQNAELSVYAFPNAPDPSPVDCFTAATFSSNAGTQTSGNCTATYTTDAIVSTVSCAGSTNEFSVGTGCSSLFVSPSNTSWKGEGKAVSAAGTYNATWASASGCTSLASIPGVIAIVAWKAADGAPNGTARHKLLFSSNQLRRAPGMGVLAPGGRSDSDSQPGRTLGAFNPDDRRGRVLPWGGGHARVTAT